jgi:glucose-fructose oxidoreductase
VLQGKDPEPSAEEGCWDVRVVDALYQSARRGAPVSLGRFGPEKLPEKIQAEDFPPLRQEPDLVGVIKPSHD